MIKEPYIQCNDRQDELVPAAWKNPHLATESTTVFAGVSSLANAAAPLLCATEDIVGRNGGVEK